MTKHHSTHADYDPIETQEWLDALDSVIKVEGADRARFIVSELAKQAKGLTFSRTTPYVNTIPVHEQAAHPGELKLEKKIRALVRWNAMAMVVRAGKVDPDLGGHIGSFASSATLYDVAFNHFFKAQGEDCTGDLIYFQGHISPGIYARSYLEGQLTQEQLIHFRREVDGKGISSYPHPWLMPNYWQFPTVSMGLGPLQAIYQARFMKYLHARGIANTQGRKVWCFCGDGEMDEPESLGAISLSVTGISKRSRKSLMASISSFFVL